MLKRLSFWIKIVLVLSLFAGGSPILYAFQQEKKQEVSKKKPVKRKTARRKKPASKGSQTNKTRTSQKARPKKKSTARKPAPKKRPATSTTGRTRQQTPQERVKTAPTVNTGPEVKKTPAFNPYEYSEEFFDIAEELNSSSRQLARATSYLEPQVKNKTVRLNSASMSAANIETLESKAVANPNDLRVMRSLGLEYERVHNFNEAKDIYLRLISHDPLNPDFHYYLGSLYQKTGEMNKAQYSFEEALALDPQHRATLDVLSTLGRPSTRREYKQADILQQTSMKDPSGPSVHVASIKKLIALGDYTGAISEADLALEKFPEYSGIRILKGNAYEHLGQGDRAKSVYQDVIKSDPMSVGGHRALGDLYFKDGKFLYAGLAYSDVVYLDGSSIDERYLQGLSFFKSREWARAANAWEDLLTIRPDHNLTLTYLPQVYYILAVEYNRTGESGLGRTSFNKAFSVNGNTRMWLPGALKTLGEFYRERSMFRESLAAFQEAAELAPNDADAYLGLGITYWKMQEPQLARGAWERSLQINPDHNESRGWMIISKQGS